MDKVFGVLYQVPMSETEEQEQAEALICPSKTRSWSQWASGRAAKERRGLGFG
jgi:hypothetical protein